MPCRWAATQCLVLGWQSRAAGGLLPRAPPRLVGCVSWPAGHIVTDTSPRCPKPCHPTWQGSSSRLFAPALLPSSAGCLGIRVLAAMQCSAYQSTVALLRRVWPLLSALNASQPHLKTTTSPCTCSESVVFRPDLVQPVFSFHSALCLFTLKPRDRRRLMPTKAHVPKKKGSWPEADQTQHTRRLEPSKHADLAALAGEASSIPIFHRQSDGQWDGCPSGSSEDKHGWLAVCGQGPASTITPRERVRPTVVRL